MLLTMASIWAAAFRGFPEDGWSRLMCGKAAVESVGKKDMCGAVV